MCSDKVCGTSGDGDCYHICKNILGQPTEYVFHKKHLHHKTLI